MMQLKVNVGCNDRSIKWKKAKYLFFIKDDAESRAMIVLVLGCDVFIGGVKGCSVSEMHE